MSHLEDPDARLFCTLKELAVDESAVIERFSRNLSASALPALTPGDRVTLTGISLDKTILKLTVNGTPQELPIAIAENIWCKK